MHISFSNRGWKDKLLGKALIYLKPFSRRTKLFLVGGYKISTDGRGSIKNPGLKKAWGGGG